LHAPQAGEVEGALLGVYDRTSMVRLATVNVLPCDDEYQDNISSVDEVPGYLVLGLECRYEVLRPNVAVVRSDGFSLVGLTAVPGGVASLISWRGNVLQCGDPGEAMRLDLTIAKLVEAKNRGTRGVQQRQRGLGARQGRTGSVGFLDPDTPFHGCQRARQIR
jgi:hypothetical protein